MTRIRAAAHVHSEWSYDAEWPLAALADAFAERGYEAVLTAEHDRGFDASRWDEYRAACAAASDDRILLVPGMEYEDPDSVVHLPVWGSEAFLGAARPTLDTLRAAREAGGAAVFAHPWRRDAVARYRREWAPLLAGVEVWNRHYDGIAPNPGGRRLAEAEGLRPFVSLDFHTRRQFFPLALSIDVNGDASPAAIVEALREGRFRPELGGTPALEYTRGMRGGAARTAELTRRSLRRPVRRVQRALGRRD